MSSNNRSLK